MKSLALAACTLCAGYLHAQVAVYVLATGEHMSNVPFTYTASKYSITPPPGTQLSGQGSFSPLGYTVGGTYDFMNVGRVHLGVDARFTSTSSKKGAVARDGMYSGTTSSGPATSGQVPQYDLAGGRVYSTLGGIRGSINTRISAIHIDPYVQASAGLIRSNFGVYEPVYNGPTGRLSAFGAFGFAGADIHLAPMVALRLEGGAGTAIAPSKPSNFDNFDVPSGGKALYKFSAGLIFHFNR